MAYSVNKVTLLGNIGRDPEVKNTQSGMKIVNLALATSDSWTDKSTGEKKEKTEWHRIVILNDRLADIAERFVRKGTKLYVEGQLQTRKWVDQQGVEKYATEIVLGRFNGDIVILGDKGSQEATTPAQPRPEASVPHTRTQKVAPAHQSYPSDEIPF